MNPRIQELAEQAEIKFESHPQHQGVDTAVIIPTDLKKFAELIVRECAGLLDGEWGREILCGSDAAGILKQHFGVEE